MAILQKLSPPSLTVNALAACAIFFISSLVSTQAMAEVTNDEKAQTAVHMLDYVSVDYPQFVKDGVALIPAEYEEQLEFATQAGTLVGELPANPQQPALLKQAAELRDLISQKADGKRVSDFANELRIALIRAYKLTVAPKDTPDLNRAAKLFASNCMACHGASGYGDGPMAKDLDPHPSNFHNEDRMRQRSIYGLYNTITLGVGGTPMKAFTELSEADRWSLAFYVNNLRITATQQQQDADVWKQRSSKVDFTDLKSLVNVAPEEVITKFGNDAEAIQRYLTLHPEALKRSALDPIAVTRLKLEQTLTAYEQGDKQSARQLAISAYLEGFELIENSLKNIDEPLRLQVEREMMDLRTSIASAKPAEDIGNQIGKINTLLERANEKLTSGNLSSSTAFVSSLIILLREGLEAVLVLAAISAFIAKTGRRDALAYFHLGWILAIVLGIATWAVANYLLTISGAGRELTEGITALIAAVMLLYIGYWLHSKSYAQAWQNFLRSQVAAALDKRTLWAMAGVSFIAVYRELFETILFYEALWAQVGPDGHSAVLGGIAAAAILLAILTWAILKYSVKLPLGKFFAATASLMALLAVVFAGNGVAALQEAGMIDSHVLQHFISVPLLGIHPTVQGITAQVIVLLLISAGMLLTRSQQAKAA
ncbi:MAG TPA: cytochrome c/FTR1 family iron permease [Methylophilaceae bacterium]|nr:cytochrome c/FTR1 family iron permease [Methylophilaceae bacterium]